MRTSVHDSRVPAVPSTARDSSADVQMVFHRIEACRERANHEGGPPLPPWVRRMDLVGAELSNAGAALEDVWLVRCLALLFQCFL